MWVRSFDNKNTGLSRLDTLCINMCFSTGKSCELFTEDKKLLSVHSVHRDGCVSSHRNESLVVSSEPPSLLTKGTKLSRMALSPPNGNPINRLFSPPFKVYSTPRMSKQAEGFYWMGDTLN